MPKHTHLKMKGRPTHYIRGDFAILRVNGSRLGLTESRYCYEFRFKDEPVKLFEYQYQARTHMDTIVREYRDIMRRRAKEEGSFTKKYELPSFPERVNT